MRTLVIATRNNKKLHELKRYLKGIGCRVVSLKEIGRSPRIVENGDTFRKNAAKKALAVSKLAKGLAIADDSGLEVKSLGGLPGVRSSRFAGPGKSDRANNAKLLNMMKGFRGAAREARFVCAACIADDGKVVRMIEEHCDGRIAEKPAGLYGFGYDPVFLIPAYDRTFGELGLRVKDRMSHRSKALRKARVFLKGYL